MLQTIWRALVADSALTGGSGVFSDMKFPVYNRHILPNDGRDDDTVAKSWRARGFGLK
jgi:hypothetical protein